MTKQDFLAKIPATITHKTLGEGKLQITIDTQYQKGVCYEHKDKKESFATFDTNWEELYKNLHKDLVRLGHLEQSRSADRKTKFKK